jgi:hypothetical protein
MFIVDDQQDAIARPPFQRRYRVLDCSPSLTGITKRARKRFLQMPEEVVLGHVPGFTAIPRDRSPRG